MMIYALISPELHEQLLDHENYQNRTNGVEGLKNIISEVDLKTVSSDSIVELINFLRRLLDDTNFKVLYGTLQVISLLVQNLDYAVDRHYKQIVCVALKTLGDARTVPRNEYMNIFRHLMRIVGPQKVLELVIGHLRHKNSRVREDVINIITAAMLTHPRKDFNIPNLCSVVAPYLADNKKRVRHAALELFAVFDCCLDTGKKQPLMKAIDRLDFTGDVEGLMAAVQARRARHILPRLSADGMVEYALVIPKPGQRQMPQFGSGADLNWVINGGKVNSPQSHHTEPDSDRLSGYSSFGSLTDDLQSHKRVVSARKAKNKLPWERSCLPCLVNKQPCSASNTKLSDKFSVEDLTTSLRLNQENCGTNSVEPFQPDAPGWKRETVGRLCRSGSLGADPDILKAANLSDSDRGLPKANRLLSGNPSVERTFSVPSNPPPPGSFLLPSYPLATLPGVQLTPTLPRRCHANSSLSMSNTWPNKRDTIPRHRDPSSWADETGEVGSNRCSPLPACTLWASTISSPSHHPPTSPVIRQSSQDTLQQELPGRNSHQDEEPVDREEMMNSLRCLRNHAAKKRAKVSASGSDPEPDSPDSAVKLEPSTDSPSHTSPSLTSPLSESSLSSLYSPPTSTITNGTKISPRDSAAKTIARVPSGRQKTSSSMEAGAQDVQQQEKVLSDLSVNVVGQRVAYCNGPAEKAMSPPQTRPAGREPLRALRPVKGSQMHSIRASPAGDVSEGVVGRGVFGFTGAPCYPGVTLSPEQEELVRKSPREPLIGVYGHAVSAGHMDSEESTEPEKAAERVKLSRFARDKMHQHRLEQQEVPPIQGEWQNMQRLKQNFRHVACDVGSDDTASLKDLQRNGSVLASTKAELLDDLPSSPNSTHAPRSLVKGLSPPIHPSPPTAPSRRMLPRRQQAPSLNRACPPLSNCSDELTPGTPRKNPHEQLVLRPFSKPDLAFTQSFKLLSSDDWEKKIDGLILMRSLARYHSDVLSSRLHDVCLVLNQEVQNLRSGVSRVALVTLGELYSGLQKGMDQEVEATAKVLLHKAGESNAFIRQDVDTALDCMVQNCTPTRSMNALLAGGLSHLNAAVRKCTSQHLATLIEKIGADRLLSGTKGVTNRILPAVSKLAQDSSQETRYFGRRMLLFLSSHHDFDKMVEKYIPTKDLATIRATVLTLKSKVPGEKPQDTPSARGRHYIPCGGMRYASSLNRQPQIVSSKDASKAQVHSIADKTKYIKQLKYTDRTRSRCVQAWPQVRILPTVRGGPNHMTRGR
ncbi:TOG array regulator of axonemal microtubules protein 1-like isoform X3 [Electrophorus electricus]|uniref:TOG array regulator of axonemal microtubules protein 1-like isoform X3 n=1 Tax=Electrophorus electricus TaxID=8005 RepID=UPI0015CF9B25|nr:TOG array regulator of axonemal microtubules protein 1-like isoform X3 [Electrophorus electricus]